MPNFVVEITNWVATVAMNRPKLNAMSPDFFSELLEIFKKLKYDSSVRCVFLKSSFSNVFTAGLDLKSNFSFPGQQGDDAAREAFKFIQVVGGLQDAISAIESCDKPVVVAVSGSCIGGGIDLITACDIRLCSEDAIFSVREVDVGLAADLGTLQRLPKVVGNDSWVRDICLTARDFGAKEAFEFGLVSKIYKDHEELLREAYKLTQIIAEKPPIATNGTKY